LCEVVHDLGVQEGQKGTGMDAAKENWVEFLVYQAAQAAASGEIIIIVAPDDARVAKLAVGRSRSLSTVKRSRR